MSRSRSRRHGSVRPENGHSSSPPNEKTYIRIVAAGCQGTRDYWGEFDCGYRWTCDECPVCVEAERLVTVEPPAFQLLTI